MKTLFTDEQGPCTVRRWLLVPQEMNKTIMFSSVRTMKPAEEGLVVGMFCTSRQLFGFVTSSCHVTNKH